MLHNKRSRKSQRMHTRRQAAPKKQRLFYRDPVTPRERLELPCQTLNPQLPAVRLLHCHSFAFWFVGEAKRWVQWDLLKHSLHLYSHFLWVRVLFQELVDCFVPSGRVRLVRRQDYWDLNHIHWVAEVGWVLTLAKRGHTGRRGVPKVDFRNRKREI